MYLYAWGANNHGQLGLGYKSNEELAPKEINLVNLGLDAGDVASIAGGHGHVLMLTKNGHVYGCGWNSHGQLGTVGDTLTFTQIEVLKEFKIVRISCGCDFSAAVSDCGKQFVWGNNNCTKLGLSKSITCTGIPTLLQVSQKMATGFKEVSCGYGHSVMLTRDSCVLAAGTGSEGQLGVGDNYDDNNYMSISKVPKLDNVISVASGLHHTVIVKEDGTVLSWGENRYGQLGKDPTISHSFVPLEIMTEEGIVSVHAGSTHTAALTANGKVFTWGRNCQGQLGEARQVAHVPKAISSIANVTSLSVGSEHTFAVTKDDALYAWGKNAHGACGTGDCAYVTVPTRIFKDRKVTKAFACTDSSFAIVE